MSATRKSGPQSPEKTISPINNLKDLLDNGRPESPTTLKTRDVADKITPIITNSGSIRIEDVNQNNSPNNGGKLESVSLQSFNAMLEKLSPRTESKVSCMCVT